MSRASLSEDAIHCRDLVRKTDPDRLLLAELAPQECRPALWALAAFNWEVARIPERVSEPMLGAIRRQWWRDAWDEIADGKPRRHPVVEALADAHARTPFDLTVVETLLQAREAEHDGPPADIAELVERAEKIGGGLAQLEATATNSDSPDNAIRVGSAWMLIGTVRNLPQMLQHGRHQLPDMPLTEHQIRLDQIDAAAPPEAFTALIDKIAQLAEDRLQGGARLSALLRGYRRLTLLYRARLRAAGHNPFDARINAPTFGRVWQVLAVRMGL